MRDNYRYPRNSELTAVGVIIVTWLVSFLIVFVTLVMVVYRTI
jgi:hypothetical protein